MCVRVHECVYCVHACVCECVHAFLYLKVTFTCTAGLTEVRVALAHSQEARTLLGVALSFTSTARKAVLTYKTCPHYVHFTCLISPQQLKMKCTSLMENAENMDSYNSDFASQ